MKPKRRYRKFLDVEKNYLGKTVEIDFDSLDKELRKEIVNKNLTLPLIGEVIELVVYKGDRVNRFRVKTQGEVYWFDEDQVKKYEKSS